MPVVSYASVSNTPSLVAISCNPESYTCKLALRAKSFSLSLLSREDTVRLETLATTHGGEVKDKLAAAGLSHVRGKTLGVPVISGAWATLECSLKKRPKLGDHILVVGEVRAAYTRGAFSDFWDFRKYRPILYTGWKNGMTSYEGPYE
jgi:flavin reductase (DIM6/NTAB) family NADH-FMN oxidoreductase RutF